ncbi:PIN domain-containing protein [Zopfochytrium polystomum]|nr:PIN domain-containing protein [Zopfochytrium polystomum]
MVPYVVVKELDSLKTSSRSSDNGPTVGYLARSAATFLLQCLKNNSSTVRGQRLDERLSFEHDSTINNDDRILECCRFSQRNMSSNVFLLTQDTILATKGEIHGIKSTSNFKVPVEKFLSSLLMAPSASTSEEILQHHAWEKPVSNRERTSIGNPSRRDSLPSPNDAMDIDVHKTQIEQANIRSVRKPLDPIDSVLHEILAMFVPSLKPALTAVFLRNGLKFPSFPSESDVRGNRRSPPCDSEEEHILYVVEAHWLFLKRDSTEGTGVYASSFKNDIPYLRSLLKDMARVRNRGIGAMNKGDLTTFLRLAPPLWDVCTAAGFPHDHSRALNLLQGWRVKLST